jgi:hypothetical protein
MFSRDFWIRRTPELRQTFRVTVAAAVAYAAYKLLGLQQGYWAVFTVLIVMQGSIGGTLGAAKDRMIGTLAGAVIGGLGAALHSGTTLGVGITLAITTGIAALGAAVYPQLRVAPVTVAIMLLSEPAGTPVEQFVVDRVIEIALGGVIGVLATVLILPARSHGVVIARAIAVLERLRKLLLSEAEAIERGESLQPSPDHPALRQALTSVEQAMNDADRERASRLADHSIPPSIPRTLWRVRNDLVLIGRTLYEPLPAPIAATLAPATARLLRAEADLVGRCAEALRTITTVARQDMDAPYHDFTETFSRMRHENVTRPLDFNAAGRVFGLAFTLENLHRDLADLTDRIDEVVTGQPRAPKES